MTKLVVKKLYTIEIESEICCEQCCEIIHNHIVECPICKEKFASTDQNCDLNEYEETTIQCDECDSCFKIVDGNWYGVFDEDEILENPYLWESLSPKVIQVDSPVTKVKESEHSSKPKYIVDPNMIKALSNFKVFEPFK